MPDTRRTDLVLLLVALVWGSSYLTAKNATEAVPVLVVLFVRYLISALAVVPLVLAAARRGRHRWTREEVRIGSVLGVTQAAVLVLETYGVTRTSAANAGLLISLTLVITPLLDRTGGRGRVPPRFYLAAGMCVGAVGLLTAGHGLRAPGAGDALILTAAVVRAGHVVLVGRLTAGSPVRALQLTSVQMAVGAGLCLVPAAGGLPSLAQASAGTWSRLVYLALFCSVFAFLAQTWAIQRTSAGRASLLLGTEPVWAAAIGIGLAGEHFTLFTALGAALMVAGTYWGQSIERAHRTAPAAVEPADTHPSTPLSSTPT
ncbi:DMT family transporter [Streptomyces bambusae]|uniref:EamA family transporter n=1 Tax=Streptomyces bambusae TaxID=1550616 RepID=A0ABS6Z5G0_9ACTN|nr:DMT family transporter [Streptomyces bambusae]MBW5482791.1 EamA family transporter [Streptomyces bambusae]